MPASRRLSRDLFGLLVLVLVALVLAVLEAAAALAAPTVTVRVEGESATLLARTAVVLNAPEPVSGCPADSVAAAINSAVGGNWDHGEVFSGGNFTDSILGEIHSFTNNSDTWAEWVDYKWGGGICTDILSEGDEVLMIADHEPEPFFAPTVLPLLVTGAPSSVQVGVPFNVQISEIRTPPEAFVERGEGTPTPVAGASVSGTGASGGLSDASGSATVTLRGVGNVVLRATKAPDAPSASFVVCAHDGNDGSCGTQGPSGTVTPTGAASTAATTYKGPFAVVASATGVLDGHVYPRGQAPKVLLGTVLAHTRLDSVSLKLRREYRGRCSAYNGASEKFAKARCGQASFFKVSSASHFSYLLPAALAPGRYVLDIDALDAAGNHSTLARGTSRIVFYVR